MPPDRSTPRAASGLQGYCLRLLRGKCFGFAPTPSSVRFAPAEPRNQTSWRRVGQPLLSFSMPVDDAFDQREQLPLRRAGPASRWRPINHLLLEAFWRFVTHLLGAEKHAITNKTPFGPDNEAPVVITSKDEIRKSRVELWSVLRTALTAGQATRVLRVLHSQAYSKPPTQLEKQKTQILERINIL